jgi:putative membrane protein
VTWDETFTEADLEAVRAAVGEAEAGTSGEIVPYVVDDSDPYPGALWKGAAFGALMLPFAAWAVHRWGGFWGTQLLFWMVLPAAAGCAFGYLAALWSPALRRLLAGSDLLDLRTQRRAAVAFLEEEVWRTRDRTGILVFVSLLERRVVILADSGIHAKVEPGRWQAISHDVAAGLAAGRAGEALIRGIRECGALLAEKGVERRTDDANELPDGLRRGGR